MSIEWNQLKVFFLSLRKYKWVCNKSVREHEHVLCVSVWPDRLPSAAAPTNATAKTNLMFYNGKHIIRHNVDERQSQKRQIKRTKESDERSSECVCECVAFTNALT